MKLLEALQIYLRVAEQGSFTAAADSLGLSRASVSGAVRQLENLLGTRLLHRTTRSVQMTQDGRVFYERSRDLLADMDELQNLFREDASALHGRLRVDMPLPVARDLVIPRLPEFLRRHPDLEIELSSTDRFVDVVREGFDCVLRVGTLEDSGLIARPLGHYRTVSCASTEYLAEHGTPRSLEDLSRHRLVHYVPSLGARPPGFEYIDPDEPDREKSLPMEGAVTVNNTAAYLEACRAGLGIIQVPEAGVHPYLESGELEEVLPQYRPAPMPVSLVYANRRHQPRRVQVFMAWIAEIMKPRLI
ncbi:MULTISPECIES: LysR family transcriptional regulator [unclassified Microbulbifer]|uniref:LysR family transcriptional regulator n=1 Tax=unclassified Microbulbifer TaxID=2619833 RepID=UPI0027E5BBAE|nr:MULTISPECIES: LysR family transcriptional regulator [unclassified Microbulbifer]